MVPQIAALLGFRLLLPAASSEAFTITAVGDAATTGLGEAFTTAAVGDAATTGLDEHRELSSGSPSPQSCVDLPGKADSGTWGNDFHSCDDYRADPGKCNLTGIIDFGEGSAQVACCACGGGDSSTPEPTPAPTVEPAPAVTTPTGPCTMDSAEELFAIIGNASGITGCRDAQYLCGGLTLSHPTFEKVKAVCCDTCSQDACRDDDAGVSAWASFNNADVDSCTHATELCFDDTTGESVRSLCCFTCHMAVYVLLDSDAESSEPQLPCQDHAGFARGTGGQGCGLYRLHPQLCGDADDSDFTARAMCCGCEGACPSGISVSLYTGVYPTEISWQIAAGSGSIACEGTPYAWSERDSLHSHVCCLTPGSYTVRCEDTYGDGWNSGYLDVGGQHFCHQQGYWFLQEALFEQSTCNGSVPDWEDVRGYRCFDYGARDWCSPDGGYGSQWDGGWGEFDDWAMSGLTALTACCECGGGVHNCVGSVLGWQDEFGYTCQDYAAEEFCTWDKQTGDGWPPRKVSPEKSIEDLAVNGVHAIMACCQCGGGLEGPVENATCEDSNEGATDAHGKDCHWYTLFRADCATAWESSDDTDFTASHMCCACSAYRCPPPPYVCSDGVFTPQADDCDLEAIHDSPPNSSEKSIDINVSWVLLDLESLNEAAGIITVMSDIQIWWRDCRLSMMMERTRLDKHGCTEYGPIDAEFAAMNGERETWNSLGNAVLHSFLRKADCGDFAAVDLWHPIPDSLLPLTSENPRSRISKHTFFQSEHRAIPGLWSAILLDGNQIEFDVTLDFAHFPFDVQTVRLEVPLAPEFHARIVASNVDMEGVKSMVDQINERSSTKYVASDFSVHAAQHVIEKFSKKGWDVTRVALEVERTGASDQVVLSLDVQRQYIMVLFRFFVPLVLLTVIPFAGFYLPVGQVMPRVATGFISFLSLTVFRNTAYALIPQTTSKILWMDVMMTILTQIIWLAVIQNVVAQAMYEKFVHSAAVYVDKQARTLFPIMSAVEILLMFTLGSLNVKTDITLAVTQTVVIGFILFALGRLWWFVRNFDQFIIKRLAKVMMSKDVLWKDEVDLDVREVTRIFRYIDKTRGDGSGRVSAEELLSVLKFHGFHFTPGMEEDQEEAFFVMFHEGSDQHGVEMDLDVFRARCMELLGGKGARRHCAIHQQLVESRGEASNSLPRDAEMSLDSSEGQALPAEPVIPAQAEPEEALHA